MFSLLPSPLTYRAPFSDIRIVSPRLASTTHAAVKRVGLVKGDVAAAVEDQLLSMAQSGQLQARVEESTVKDMLAKTSTTRAEKKVTITRRNVMSDDEDNDDDLR